MWVEKFEVVNVGPFRNLELQLTRGSIGVVGRNGAGKSSLLRSLFALLTGDFGRFAGLKVDCINNQADKKEPSYLAGVVHHGAHTLEIRRNLRGKAAVELRVSGGTTITDANKAQEAIDELLGVDKAMLDLYVFKEQDRIYDFLATTPAQRAKAFAVLCRTERCEEIWDYLGEVLNKDVSLRTEIVDNSDDLVRQISEAKDQSAELDNRIESESQLLLNTKSKDSAQAILRRRDRWSDLQRDREQVLAKLAVSRSVLAEAQQEAHRLENREKALVKEVTNSRADAVAAQAALKVWSTYEAQRLRQLKLKDEATALAKEKQQYAEPVPPDLPDGTPSAEELRKQITILEGELDRARKTVETFRTTGRTECPTCGTAVTSLKSHLDEQRRVVREHPKEINRLEDLLDALVQYDVRRDKYSRWQDSYQLRLKANRDALNRDALAACADLKAPVGDAAKLQTQIDQYQAQEAALEKLRRTLRAATTIASQADAQFKAQEQRLVEITAGLEDNAESDERVDKARRRLEEHTAAEKNVERARGQRDGLKQLIRQREQDLEALRASLRRSRKLRRMADIVAEVREVLHRDVLPQRVAAANLARMEGDINDGLELFGNPFWVESDSRLNFIAHKPGEPPQPAGWLSTGQRVILALAFWPAVASLWETDLGMLALDEPTANLDEDNRRLLGQALGTLTARVRGRRQLLMVTHDTNLRSAFDQIIEL